MNQSRHMLQARNGVSRTRSNEPRIVGRRHVRTEIHRGWGRSLCLCLMVLSAGLPGNGSLACADDGITFPEWQGIPRLSVDLSQDDAAPFVKYTEPKTKAGAPSSQNSTASRSAERLQTAREELRESLVRDGESSAADRDALTAEFFSVMRWTIVALVVGGVLAFSLKRLSPWNRPPVSGTRMSIMESLPLGRHQMLNLVQAGGERFLVASDPGGIRSVTLLPNWPTEEEAALAESPAVPSAPVKLFTPPIPSQFRTSEAA